MPAVKKIISNENRDVANGGKKAIDYQNDPFVLKKLAEAREMLNRPGMQEQLKKLAENYKENA